MKKIISFVLLFTILVLCFTGCKAGVKDWLSNRFSRDTVDSEGLWEDAIYRRDMAFGKGEKTVTVEVKAGDKSVIFTVHTDERYLADALLEHGIIEGEDGPYGLYIKKVNGITADYDIDGSYWLLTKGGEMMMVGVSDAELEDGDKYELTYTK